MSRERTLRHCGKSSWMAALAFLAAGLSWGSAAVAVEKVPMPFGATDLHFRYNAGDCAIVRIQAYGGTGSTSTSNSEGCVNDQFDINFSFTGDPADGFYLFPIFEVGAPETKNRKTVPIVDAYWTYKGAFYEPVWTDGKQRVAVIPEPSTWALMLLGVGAIGATLRKRARVLPSPAAA